MQWLVTAPNPRLPGYAEPYGWKLHAVEVEETTKLSEIDQQRSICGLRPCYGWTIDLFIPDEVEFHCKRCERIGGKNATRTTRNNRPGKS